MSYFPNSNLKHALQTVTGLVVRVSGSDWEMSDPSLSAPLSNDIHCRNELKHDATISIRRSLPDGNPVGLKCRVRLLRGWYMLSLTAATTLSGKSIKIGSNAGVLGALTPHDGRIHKRLLFISKTVEYISLSSAVDQDKAVQHVASAFKEFHSSSLAPCLEFKRVTKSFALKRMQKKLSTASRSGIPLIEISKLSDLDPAEQLYSSYARLFDYMMNPPAYNKWICALESIGINDRAEDRPDEVLNNADNIVSIYPHRIQASRQVGNKNNGTGSKQLEILIVLLGNEYSERNIGTLSSRKIGSYKLTVLYESSDTEVVDGQPHSYSGTSKSDSKVVPTCVDKTGVAYSGYSSTGACNTENIVLPANGDCAIYDNRCNNIACDYVLMVGPGVVLREKTLDLLCNAMLSDRQLSLVYGDHDWLTQRGERTRPILKPEWNPELLKSGNYVGRCFLVSKQLLNKVGGFCFQFADSMEYDFLLKVSEVVHSRSVKRVAAISHHCINPEFGTVNMPLTDMATGVRDVPALDEHLSRTGVDAEIIAGDYTGSLRLKRRVADPEPSVNIIIPTRDQFELLSCCIESIKRNTIYTNYRITIVDNNTTEALALEFLSEVKKIRNIDVVSYQGEFNYSALNNHVVRDSEDEILVLLNNDTEVITGNWLAELVSLASVEENGCVGAKLLYSNGRIQHAGVVVGLKGMAGHVYRFSDSDADGYCGRLKLAQNVTAVTGACLAVRNSVFVQAGGLDEVNLKVAYNDVDFCLRVLELGYRNVWTPHALLYHHESVSRGQDDTAAKRKRFLQEFNYMQKRWKTADFVDPAYHPFLTHDAEDVSLAESIVNVA